MLRGACLSSEEESQGAEATGLGPGETLRAHRPAEMGWLRTKPQLREGRVDERFIKHHVRAAGASRDHVRQARQPASHAVPFPPPGAKSAAACGPTYSPGIVPATAAQSVPRRARKKSRGSWLSGGVSLGPLFVGPQGRVGWAAHQGAAIVELRRAVLSVFPHLSPRPLIATDNQGYYLFFLA